MEHHPSLQTSSILSTPSKESSIMVLKDLFHCALQFGGLQQGVDCVRQAFDFAPLRAIHHYALLVLNFPPIKVVRHYSFVIGLVLANSLLRVFLVLGNALLTILLEPTVELLLISVVLGVVSYSLLLGEGEERFRPKGCKQISRPKVSTLTDQYDEKYSSGVQEGKNARGIPNWRIKGLFVHPIKSCQLVEVDEIEILDTGCKYDRSFVFAEWKPHKDTKILGWKMITMRDVPKLAHIKIDIWEPDVKAKRYSPDADYAQSGGYLVISYPVQKRPVDTFRNLSAVISQRTLSPWARRSFRVPFLPTPADIKRHQLASENVKVFSDSPKGINMANYIGGTVLKELGVFLGLEHPLTLFRKDPSVMREVHKNAEEIEDLGYQANANFADSFPINLLNLASVHDVASKLPPDFGEAIGHKLNAARFRCNFLITGPPAYAEETWKSIHLLHPTATPSESLFHVTNRTTRCNLPNTDPDQTNPALPNVIADRKAVGHNQPLRTMEKHRAVDRGDRGKACLGMMLVPGKETVGMRVKVGSEIEVLTTGRHRLVK